MEYVRSSRSTPEREMRTTTTTNEREENKTKTTREQFKKRALFRALCFFASSKSRNVSCALFVYMRTYVRSSSSSRFEKTHTFDM